MNMETRMPRQPTAHALLLVGAVVVHDQVQRQDLGRLPVDLLEKAQPFDVGMMRLQARDELAVEGS